MLFLIFSVLLYFLPTLMARDKPDVLGVFLVNLLLGWTVIGWFVALVWACAGERYVPVRVVPLSSGRICSQCGTLSPYCAHFCSSCGRAV